MYRHCVIELSVVTSIAMLEAQNRISFEKVQTRNQSWGNEIFELGGPCCLLLHSDILPFWLPVYGYVLAKKNNTADKVGAK